MNSTTLEDHPTSAEVEAKIRQTRHRMDSTLDQLGNRLTARSLVNSALDWWDSPEPGNQGSAAVRKVAMNLGRQAKRHPMPAVLIGAGVAWLISESRDHAESIAPTRVEPHRPGGNGFHKDSNGNADTSSSVGKWVGDKMDGIKDSAADAMDTVKDKTNQLGSTLHHATDVVGDKAHRAMDLGKSAATRLKQEVVEDYRAGAQKFTQACDEYPLAVGVAFAALGALAGLVIPRTRREDELMGEQSDRLLKETKDKASELLETGKEMGSRVLETVKDEARDQGLTGATVSETLSDLAERGGAILSKAKDEALHVIDEKKISRECSTSED